MSILRYGPEVERLAESGDEASIASVVIILGELVKVVNEQSLEISLLRRRSCYQGPAA